MPDCILSVHVYHSSLVFSSPFFPVPIIMYIVLHVECSLRKDKLNIASFMYCMSTPEIVYCSFTRATLCTTMLTVIILVCSLKGMRVTSSGCCVSELHAHKNYTVFPCSDARVTHPRFHVALAFIQGGVYSFTAALSGTVLVCSPQKWRATAQLE